MLAFLKILDRDLPQWNLTALTRAVIDPRIALAWQIVEQRRQDCEARHWEPPSSTQFREEIIRLGFGIDDAVYDNPIWIDVYGMFRSMTYVKLYGYWGKADDP